MYTIYRINADDLDDKFLESLRSAFRHKQIEIAVTEADETEYLLRSPANRDRLRQALADADAGKNMVTPDQTPFR